MPVPKRKVSRSRRNNRSSCKFIREKSVAVCQTCEAPVAPHQVCKECGRYKGVKVKATKADRMHKRGQARKEVEAKKMASRGVAEQEEKTENKE